MQVIVSDQITKQSVKEYQKPELKLFRFNKFVYFSTGFVVGIKCMTERDQNKINNKNKHFSSLVQSYL